MRLLFVLLDRRELASYIRTFGHLPRPHQRWNYDEKDDTDKEKRLQSQLWGYMGAIRNQIENVLSSDSGLENIHTTRLAWLGSIVLGPVKPNKGLDHTIALVMCMSNKLERIKLYEYEYEYNVVRNYLARPRQTDTVFQDAQALEFRRGNV